MMGWGDLPPELAISIARRLPISDVVRLRAVCRSWGLAMKDLRLVFGCFPWLAVTPDVYFFVTVFSSVDGWLVTKEKDSPILMLINPITNQRLRFPLPRALHPPEPVLGDRYTIQRVMFAAEGSGNIVAFARLYNGKKGKVCLAFARPGAKTWSPVDVYPCELSFLGSADDVVFHDDRYYALIMKRYLVAFHLDPAPAPPFGRFPNPSQWAAVLAKNIPQPESPYEISLGSHYLVSCPPLPSEIPTDGASGHVLLRVRRVEEVFEVSKFDRVTDRWMEIKDLGSRALFLDSYRAMVVPSAADPLKGGPRRNCIYFVDSWRIINNSQQKHGGGGGGGGGGEEVYASNVRVYDDHLCASNVRVYNVGKGILESEPLFSRDVRSELYVDPMMAWFMPNLSML